MYQVNRQISEIYFREALHIWEQVHADVVFFTDIDEYTSYIKEQTTLPVYTTPMGLEFYDDIGITEPKGTEEAGYTFVAAGIPHKAKGSNLLSQAIHRHTQQFPKKIDLLFKRIRKDAMIRFMSLIDLICCQT